MAEHTPTPWSVHKSWPAVIVMPSHVDRSIGGSIHEDYDREHFALVIARACADEYSGFTHEIPKSVQKANAAFIVTAVNNHEPMVAMLRRIARAARLPPKLEEDIAKFLEALSES